MSQYAQEGQRVRLRDGTVAVVRNGQLVSEASPGAPAPRKLSAQEQRDLQGAVANAEATREVRRDVIGAQAASRRLNSGPWKGAFLDAAIPSPGGGFWDKLGGFVVGGPARLVGAIDNQDVQDYQTLMRAQNEGVLARQLAQKGPQTESDAMRIAMTGLSTGNTHAQNRVVAGKAQSIADRASARAQFLTQWANRHGLYGVNERGQSADQAFEQVWRAQHPPANQQTSRPRPARPGTPTIRRVQ